MSYIVVTKNPRDNTGRFAYALSHALRPLGCKFDKTRQVWIVPEPVLVKANAVLKNFPDLKLVPDKVIRQNPACVKNPGGKRQRERGVRKYHGDEIEVGVDEYGRPVYMVAPPLGDLYESYASTAAKRRHMIAAGNKYMGREYHAGLLDIAKQYRPQFPGTRRNPEDVKTTIVYTGAPQGADYEPSTRELEVFEFEDFGRRMMCRKVAITNDAYRTAYQCDRYGSFLGGFATLDDPRKVPLGTGRPAPTNYRRNPARLSDADKALRRRQQVEARLYDYQQQYNRLARLEDVLSPAERKEKARLLRLLNRAYHTLLGLKRK